MTEKAKPTTPKPPLDRVRDAVKRIGRVYEDLSPVERQRVEQAIAALYPVAAEKD